MANLTPAHALAAGLAAKHLTQVQAARFVDGTPYEINDWWRR